jgi:hypothetical protein
MNNDILSNLSVVVQGRIFGDPHDPYEKQLTLQCIESIRNLMPQAEIIVSTWEGSDVSHLSYDKVVFSEDPGGTAYNIHEPKFLNNNNRQIVSTYNGLKAATKKYAIKMRGDCKFIDTDFVKYWQTDYPRADKYRFFKERVIILTHFSRSPRRIPQLIHPSDLFYIGLLEDLLNLWNIPLQPEPQTTRAFPLEKRIINNSLESSFYRMKFGAEQYIWYSFCKKNGLDLELKYFGDIPKAKILASEMSIINNFIIVEPEKLGLLMPKRFINYPFNDLYSHQEWLKLNKIYASGASKLFEWKLIFDVYKTNVLLVAGRAKTKLAKHGLSKFFRVQTQALVIESE